MQHAAILLSVSRTSARQGGSDFDLNQPVALCRWCHDQRDAPYERGRLVVTALGSGRICFDVIERPAREREVIDFAHVGKIIRLGRRHPSRIR
jgi:hypothetical protein